MGKFLKLTALVAATCCLILAATVGQTQQPNPIIAQPMAAQFVPPKVESNPRLITPQELQRQFTLVGALGRPANEIMTLDIEIVDFLKGESGNVVHVWKINGQALQQPVRIDYSIWRHAIGVPKMVKNQLYEVRAFEDIRYDSGLPTEAYVENNVPVPQAGGWGFRSNLNIIRVLR